MTAALGMLLALSGIAVAQRGPHAISGSIKLPNGSPPSQRIEITITRIWGAPLRVYADAGGLFFFRGLTAGTYTVSARAPYKSGLKDVSTEVVIYPGPATVLTANLTFQPETPERRAIRGGRTLSIDETDAGIPKEAKKLYKQAVELSKKDPHAAVERFRQALLIAPDYLFALNDLGAQMLRLGEYGEATVLLERAVMLAPSSFPPRLNLAIAFLETAQLERAAEHITVALQMDPGSASALFVSGRIGKRMGHADAAAEAFKRAYINGGAGMAAAQLELGQLYEENGMFEAAIEAYRTFLTHVTIGADADRVRQRLRALGAS
jgi:tetratricopeptide (TPR) repeat protein